MKHHDEVINRFLCNVVERFQFHRRIAKEGRSEMTRDAAAKMCEIEMWEMWVLTQS